MFTDMVGWSALAQQDERTALALLGEHQGILRGVFPRFHGREVKSTGDGFLVEFESALDATECGVEIQRALFERNHRPEVKRIEVRIGIHEGDVVHSDNDVLGDAVNIASRIEPLAEAGGIAVTEPVFEQVRNKLSYSWTPIERAFLKNIEFPVTVYRIELPWQAPRAGGLTPFIDRTAEMDALSPLVKAASRGEGMAIALSGEPGIGKTRLAEELVRQSEKTGFRALRGRGHRGEIATPYAHWAELVREFAKDAPSPLLYKVCANCSREIVQLVPELAERLGPGPPGPVTSPEQAQVRFFDGIAQFFESIAKESPLILLFDDLQWADSASLRVLGYFGRRIGTQRILVVLTYREPESPENAVLREVVEELGRAHLMVHRSLKRFDADTTARMLGHLFRHDPQASLGELARVVHEKTGGNPFFLESVAQALIEEGALEWTQLGWVPKPGVEIRLPPGVQSLIRQRMKHLDEGTVSTLRMASVLGSQFTFTALRQLTDVPEEELLNQLERGLQSHLLEERPTSSGGSIYAFSDFQIRDALYTEISLVRRGRLHLKSGQILEGLPSPAERIPAGELAHHFLLGNDPEKALEYTLRAADEAAQFYAREEALRQYGTALELLDSRPQDPRRLEVLEKQAGQLNLLGKPEEALALRRQVAEQYERAGLSQAAGRIHRIIAREFSVHNEPVRAMEHWEKARQLLETGPESVDLARLYDTMGGFLYEAGKTAEATEMYGKALAIAERVGDPRVQATAQMILAALVPLEARERVFEYLEAALVAARKTEFPEIVSNVEMLLAMALLHIRGDGRGAVRKLEDAIEVAHRNHDMLSEMELKGNLLAYTYWRIGDLERSERIAQEYRTYAGDDPRRARATVLIVLADVSQSRGQIEAAEKWLWEAEKLLEEGGDWTERAHMELVLARCALRRQRPDSAIEHLTNAHGLSRGAGPPAMNAIFHLEVTSQLVESHLASGSVAAAEAFRNELSETADRFGEDLGRAFQHRAEGFWALHHHDFTSAVEHFELCVELWKRLGWRYELARARSALGVAYSKQNLPQRGQAMAEQADEFFRKVGATAEAGALRKADELDPPAPPAGESRNVPGSGS